MTPAKWSAMIAPNMLIEASILAVFSLALHTWTLIAYGSAFGLYITAVMAVGGNWVLSRRFRGSVKVFLLALLAFYVVWPLRLVTGRRAPDHAAIARMERDVTR